MIEQTRRHAAIAALLRIPHVMVAVNKMDLVGFGEERFDEVVREVLELRRGSACTTSKFIPISALNGDNVVDRSRAQPWYDGPPLLDHLETVRSSRRAVHGARLPVQVVTCAARADPLGRGAARRAAR